ncbi:MAG: anhydro-N-acetylmuramic acid kinase [Sulfurovum sp.]|nr:MAG: anhydro-N-acetylmuramic acid kinase [Sulfurovum sp.]TQV61806.1 MAG: anhydro-N-acetylmuramic acid kinase [Halothiobacillaceae bacterium]
MELYIGLLSGTSMDGMDACLVDFRPSVPRILGSLHKPYPHALLAELRALLRPAAEEGVHRMARLDAWLGELFGATALELLQNARPLPAPVIAIGSHGQTLRHCPQGDWPYTLQIGDPHRIAERTGLTVVADFRRRDLAAGGQGAPLVPPAHAAFFGHDRETRIIANIGGISNITILPRPGPDGAQPAVWGFDTGPGNTLMDAWILRHRDLAFDEGGAWARQGRAHEALLDKMLATPYFHRPPPKSTGPEMFNLDWLEAIAPVAMASLTPEDVQATLLELTARTLLQAARTAAPDADRLLVCGGGAFNEALMGRLRELAGPMPVESTAAHGVDPAWVEALAFAWLARQAMNGRAGNLPAVTGARGARILGAIYPATPGGA